MATNKRLALLALLLIVLFGPAFAAAGEDAESLISQGETKLAAGEIDAGLTLFRQAAAEDPKSALAQTRIGGALLLKQDHAEAIEAFRDAIALDQANAAAFVGMAIAYLHAGDYALARAALQEARRIDPDKGEKIDELLAWIAQREAGDQGAH